ncbi:hypothetical protein QTH90_17575 [Variovorax sp. J2P1-59]|uniref:hypothetical protein n=1 Tax=Variovorax flavidus TaxID=3053501 RepID=UPI00257656B0|nr:hypothetical protein [Variovorax sp. J2P1-59]MDM0076222.1 hypothetical protein [Variovorax sp. J2P1-59]
MNFLRRSPKGIALALLALQYALLAMPAQAATFRVDDTGTLVSQPVTPMKWRQMVPSRTGDNAIEGQLSVALRLNLTNWVNRPARIFMGLAPTEGEQLVATWRTQGRLLPGSVQGGSRTLVFDGVVRDPFLTETIQLNLLADGRLLTRTQRLQFFFEIEVSP